MISVPFGQQVVTIDLIFCFVRNASEPVDGRATNNVGEIQAAIHAIWTCSNEGVRRLRINTDSKFLCNAVWYWMERWEENDFCKTNGDPLANQDDFMELSHALNENDHMDIDFVHVHAHSGNKYNNAADRLARDGAHQYEYEY